MGKFTETWSLAEYRAYIASGGRTKPVAPVKKAEIASAPIRNKRALAQKFEDAWAVLDPSPAYVVEAQVHPDRRFLFDYLWVEQRTALELQGGIYMATKGHVNPKQFRSDCTKLNLANTLGIVVFKLATGMVTADNLLLIRDFLLTR